MKHITSIFLVVCFVLSCNTAGDDSSRFLIFEKEGLYGFADSAGVVRIAPCYTTVMPFDSGTAIVEVGNKWGLIDWRGDTLRDFQFEEPFEFSEGLAAVQLGSKWGFIDRKGNTKVSFKFDDVYGFNDGQAWVSLDGKWGRIDSRCKYDIDPIYDYPITDLGGGGVCKYSVNKKWGLMDSLGDYITSPEYEEMGGTLVRERFETTQRTLINVKKDGKWGYIRTNGVFAIEPKYSIARPFSENLARASTTREKDIFGEGTYGFIDTTGTFVIKEIFDSADDFREGLAAVEYKGKYGFIDHLGKFIIKPHFKFAWSFSEGLAAVEVESENYRNNWGFIDKKGNIVIRPQFAMGGIFIGGLAAVQQNLTGPFGFIDTTGTWVIYPQFEYMPSGFNGDSARIYTGEETYYIDRTGQRISR